MGCVKEVEKVAAPILGGLAGSILLPGIGTEIGADIGGLATVGGALGAAAGGAATGASGAGIALDAIGGGIAPNVGDIVSSASDAFGFSGGAAGSGAAIDSSTGLQVGQEATNGAGATINSATGETVAAPSTSTATAGGGFTSPSQTFDLGSNAISTAAGGPSTSAATNLGSIGATATDAIGSTVGNIDPTTINLNSAPVSGASASGVSGGASNSILSRVEDAGIKSALPVGALAYNAIKGPAKLPSASGALAPNGAATAPLLALENQGATEAQTGQLTPAQQSTITQGIRQQENLLLQQLASQGVTDPTHDSRYLSGMQQIQEWAQAQQQQYITAAIQEAVSAGGAASGNIATVANEQIQNDSSFQQSLAEAFGALGGITQVGGTRPNTPNPIQS